MQTAFLFPGQGSQVINMEKYLPEDKIVKETIQEAEHILDIKFNELTSESALLSTHNVQLALLITAVSVYRIFEAKKLLPNYVLGHSIGAFGAAVASKVISFQDALQLVELRGRLMKELHPEGFGMAVVIGMNEQTLQGVIDDIYAEDKPIYLANINSPSQITVSGHKEKLLELVDLVIEKGVQCANLLKVNTPSHSPLLRPVEEALKNALSKIKIHEPKIPYIGNYNARVLYEEDDIVEDLSRSISSSVKWYDATRVAYEKGARLFIELPPNNVLTNLTKKSFTDVRALSIFERGLDDCFYLMET